MNEKYYLIDENGFPLGYYSISQSFYTVKGDKDVIDTYKKPQYINGEWAEGWTEKDQGKYIDSLTMLDLYKNDLITRNEFNFHMLGEFVDTMCIILKKIEDENYKKTVLTKLLMWSSDNETQLQAKITEKYDNKCFEFESGRPIVEQMNKNQLIHYYEKTFMPELQALRKNNFMG